MATAAVGNNYCMYCKHCNIELLKEHHRHNWWKDDHPAFCKGCIAVDKAIAEVEEYSHDLEDRKTLYQHDREGIAHNRKLLERQDAMIERKKQEIKQLKNKKDVVRR